MCSRNPLIIIVNAVRFRKIGWFTKIQVMHVCNIFSLHKNCTSMLETGMNKFFSICCFLFVSITYVYLTFNKTDFLFKRICIFVNDISRKMKICKSKNVVHTTFCPSGFSTFLWRFFTHVQVLVEIEKLVSFICKFLKLMSLASSYI